MKIEGSTPLVTGANRGLGKVFVENLVERGAARVHATAPDRESLNGLVDRFGDKVVATKIDVRRPDEIRAAALVASDCNFLINNAGVTEVKGLFEAGSVDAMRSEMDVNTFGLAQMCLEFAPVIERNGGGTILNVLSLAAVFGFPFLGGYAASKAASMSLTQSMRYELIDRGVDVVAMYAGFIDTDMTKELVVETVSPVDVVNAALDGVEAGLIEIDTHEEAMQVRAGMRLDPETTSAMMWEYSVAFRAANPLQDD